MTRTVGHLFAGIDGFGIGLTRGAGWATRWTVELNDYSHAILKQREPGAEHLRDVLEVVNPPRVDVLTGGFPCQDLSVAGKGAGIHGRRSGLWGQYARIIGEVDPELVLIENVPALLHRGFEVVVRDLVDRGYRVEWDCLPAAAFGAPHLRDRVFVAAHRLAGPSIFGQPAALFPVAPGQAVDLVGGDDDLDHDDATTPAAWARWPRAGWVDGDPGLVMPLEPLATLAAVKAGLIFDPWPTPAASLKNYDEDPEQFLARKARNADKDEDATRAGIPLGVAVRLGADSPRRYPDADARFPTPVARDWKGAGRDGQLGTVAAQWPTPNARDGTGGSSDARKRRAHGRQVNLRDHVREVVGLADPDDLKRASVAAGGSATALNPAWVEWLMGFPLGWTDRNVQNSDLTAHPWDHGEPPGIPRVAANVADRRHRLTALGNALVPPAAEWLAARYHHAAAAQEEAAA